MLLVQFPETSLSEGCLEEGLHKGQGMTPRKLLLPSIRFCNNEPLKAGLLQLDIIIDGFEDMAEAWAAEELKLDRSNLSKASSRPQLNWSLQ